MVLERDVDSGAPKLSGAWRYRCRRALRDPLWTLRYGSLLSQSPSGPSFPASNFSFWSSSEVQGWRCRSNRSVTIHSCRVLTLKNMIYSSNAMNLTDLYPGQLPARAISGTWNSARKPTFRGAGRDKSSPSRFACQRRDLCHNFSAASSGPITFNHPNWPRRRPPRTGPGA